MASAVDEPPPLAEGWLYKRSHVLRVWRRRKAVLKPGQFRLVRDSRKFSENSRRQAPEPVSAGDLQAAVRDRGSPAARRVPPTGHVAPAAKTL